MIAKKKVTGNNSTLSGLSTVTNKVPVSNNTAYLD